MSETLLRIAERGDVALLIEQLEPVSRKIHASLDGGAPLKDGDKLIDEALWYARQGDIDEAKLRLERRARPKFWHRDECQAAYDAAMAEKRARAAQ